MCATADITEQRLGMITLFQTDQRRESLTIDRQLTERTAVSNLISRKEDSFRCERSGLGQGLADVDARALGSRTAHSNRWSLILAGE